MIDKLQGITIIYMNTRKVMVQLHLKIVLEIRHYKVQKLGTCLTIKMLLNQHWFTVLHRNEKRDERCTREEMKLVLQH